MKNSLIHSFVTATATSASAEVASRAGRLSSHLSPRKLGVPGTSIHFLRGVGSRATFSLSSFYFLIAASSDGTNPCVISGYPGSVLQSQMHFASLNAIALACRKTFDHGKGLTGAMFGRLSDSALTEHAKYWSTHKRSYDDAHKALQFLRSLFAKCSRKPDSLFKSGSTLERRIGFLKQYADRSAAHLSLDEYEFDVLDVAHVVAALTLIGSVVSSFDDGRPPTYFNDIDEASFEAAAALFPEAPKIRLFEHMKVDMQARLTWQGEHSKGIQMFTEQLPYAIGWY